MCGLSSRAVEQVNSLQLDLVCAVRKILAVCCPQVDVFVSTWILRFPHNFAVDINQHLYAQQRLVRGRNVTDVHNDDRICVDPKT